MTLGQRIKDLREELGLTQEAFSKQLGISKSAIGMYETNKREPNLETLDAIADFFNVDMDYLRGKTDCRNYEQWVEQSRQEMEAALREMGFSGFTISDTNPQLDQLMANAQRLNADGQQQLVEYSELLVASGKYEIRPMDFEAVERLRREYSEELKKGGE